MGYGSWARTAYLPALRRDGRASVVWVGARSEATRQLARTELGADITLLRGLEDLPTAPAVDAILIAVPDSLHELSLSMALEGSAAILYEAPLSDQRARILPILRRLLATDRVTFADLELGFIPAVVRAAEVVKSGDLGDLQTATISLESDWGSDAAYDLCHIHALAPWYVDPLNLVLGATPQRVLVLDGHGAAGRRQNRTIGHFEYGATWGTLDVKCASLGKLNVVVEVNGNQGDVVADLLTGEVRWRTRRHPAWIQEQRPALTPCASWPGMHECVAAFLDAVERGHATVNGAMTLARLHMVGLAAEESKDTGTWADVHEVPQWGSHPV